MKVLVAAASRYGATQEIADAIGRVLTDHGIDVKVVRAEGLDNVTLYDAVVLGSGVYMGNWLAPARRFVEEYGEELASRPTWLFSSGPLGPPLRPQEGEAVHIADLGENERHRAPALRRQVGQESAELLRARGRACRARAGR